jgi:hypothetical protein
MKKITVLMIGFFMVFSMQSCEKDIETLIDQGEFTKAEQQIDKLIGSGELTESDVWDLIAQKETMHRIRLDFNKDLEDVLPRIKEYYPEVTSEQIRKWEKEKALEYKRIDGKKKYFYNAAPNLFRIDPQARAVKKEKDQSGPGSLDQTLDRIIPRMVDQVKQTGKNLLDPVRMRLNYTATLKADEIPAGEIVRCWLPYPREGHDRQTDIKLISTSEDEYVIADNKHLQRSIYMEKVSETGKPTIFNVVFEITTRPEVYLLKEEDVKPYDPESELYKEFTSERETHILFTPEIKALSEKIVGDENHPLKIARKLFTYINDHYPWASACEYSTISNIPSYVMENNSGDCGQVTLLLLTLCRYNGIPARWQSGWMLHPGDVNLHDWGELYFEGVGWVPVDQSFGRREFSEPEYGLFFLGGIDPYRLIVNDDYSTPLYPAKTWLRSETVDFQRGEMEWKGGNIYFNRWVRKMDVEYLENSE